MKLSLSHKLFIEINKRIGSHPLVDRFMTFSADHLIYIHAFIIGMWGTTVLFERDPLLFDLFLKLLLTAFFFGFVTSWLIAIISPHHRPIRELPYIHQLIKPLSTWKSFPSDHTITAFTLFEITFIMGIPGWFSLLLLVFALMISFGRVYVGVHYPRDIIGGFLIATFFSYSSFWFLTHITQPMYTAFKLLFL